MINGVHNNDYQLINKEFSNPQEWINDMRVTHKRYVVLVELILEVATSNTTYALYKNQKKMFDDYKIKLEQDHV